MREVIYLVLNSRNKKKGLTPCFSVPANLCVKVLMSSEKNKRNVAGRRNLKSKAGELMT